MIRLDTPPLHVNIELPIAEIIQQKIDYHQSKIDELNVILSSLESQNPAFNHGAVLGSKETFRYPSKGEITDLIMDYLKANFKLVKTSEMVAHHYSNIVDRELKMNITRRFSGVLNELKKKGKVFCKQVIGEKGDFYTLNKSLIK